MESVQNKIVKAALLGAGTVGSGVYELVKERQGDFPISAAHRSRLQKFLFVMLLKKERESHLIFLLIAGKRSSLMTASLLL